MPKGIEFDGGLSATVPDDHWIIRQIRFTNGSGDDVVDAVRSSLGVDRPDEDEASIDGDPLLYWIAQED